MHRMVAHGKRVDGRPEHIMSPFPDMAVDTPCDDQHNKKTELRAHDAETALVRLVADVGEGEDDH